MVSVETPPAVIEVGLNDFAQLGQPQGWDRDNGQGRTARARVVSVAGLQGAGGDRIDVVT
jgi:hypothetical protein